MSHSKTLFISFMLLALLPGCKELKPYLDTAKDLAQSTAPTSQESAQAIRTTLDQGIEKAVAGLGKQGGFSSSRYRVPLPQSLTDFASRARQIGLGRYVDDFETSMNNAAEKAVPQALTIFKSSIRNMTLTDVVSLLRGGDTAITDFFRKNSTSQLKSAFLPKVQQATSQVGVTQDYKRLTDQVSQYGRLLNIKPPAQLDLDTYVTDHAIASLFTEIEGLEKNFRANPLQQSSALIRKVFSYYQ
ncbi:DUF4197 domain-containing protein [Pleionea litopenaei]|uniref:DUF4197 domain-containing protein n=1 Tax=Pleionea litopenaei TaxID=3070815 RepID=A0AA51X5C0_9GAMM|nr:DUF4197 domain-containing protein [Pleionea sp. HL-JVS1]WMS85718.1 DUF4197 domain-containing protein [Pleionea sp. HL-JVS1]